MTPQTPSKFEPALIPDGRVNANGHTYMTDTKGGLVPISLVKAQDQLQDETVRKIAGYALALSDQTARFKEHVFNDIGDFEAILEQEYGSTIGGARGNKTLMSFDGLFKVQVSVADQFDFGPELQIAKGLLDECLNEWSAEAPVELQAIVTNAFNTDKEGQINRAEIYKLLQLEIQDERWQRAMQAIRDAMRVVGKSTYVRCYQRPAPDAKWQHITIDLAKA
ncbi:DUF3164 family protein [Parasedimentitalea huanghaiensis]|uniref:DUF3164 family protein n=1 Tax=Parasedimentitalea huanghaiensis TaxID=2682100 RepID=A0A6L6WMG9_9RHOB|nr:DUF3164 family protein [Zongyanglinia huanghaiensis]MVO16832.1 DUF3164 family protein [Zongyanglinia huanghaiensis]